MGLEKLSVLVLAAATLGACIDFHGQLNTIGSFPTQQRVLNQYEKTGDIIPASVNGFYGNENRMVYHPPTGNTVQDFVNAYRAAQTPKRDFVPIHEPRQEPPNTMPTFPPFQAKEMHASIQVMPSSFQVAVPQSSYGSYSTGNQEEPAVLQKSRIAIPIVQVSSTVVTPAPTTPISYQYAATKYGDARKPNMFTHSNAFGENAGQFDAAKYIDQVNQGSYPLKDLSYDQLVAVPSYGQPANIPKFGSEVYKGYRGYATDGFNSQGDYASTSANSAGYGFNNYPVLQKSDHNLNAVSYQVGNYAPRLSYAPYRGYSSANALANKINNFNKNVYSKNVNGFNAYTGYLKSSLYPVGTDSRAFETITGSKLYSNNDKGVYLIGKF